MCLRSGGRDPTKNVLTLSLRNLGKEIPSSVLPQFSSRSGDFAEPTGCLAQGISKEVKESLGRLGFVSGLIAVGLSPMGM